MNRLKTFLKNYIKIIRPFSPVTVFIWLAAGTVISADTLFTDCFTSPGISNGQWAVVAEGEDSPSFSDGTIRYKNRSFLYSAFVLHSFRNPIDFFTSSIRIMCPYPGCGIFLCTDKKTGFLDGLAVIIGSGDVRLYEYNDGSQEPIENIPTRFLDSAENILAVSSDGNSLRIFCNGVYIGEKMIEVGSVSDVGIVLPPQSEVAFDDVAVTDAFSDTVRFSEIDDDMRLESNGKKWYYSIHGGAVWERREEGLSVTSQATQPWYAWLPVPLEDFSVSVVISKVDKDDSCRYGLMLSEKRCTGTVADPLMHYSISADSIHFENFSDGSNKQSFYLQALSRGAEGDTLSLMKKDEVYTCMLNGDTVTVYLADDIRFGSVGVFTAGKGEGVFSDFQLKDNGASIPVSLSGQMRTASIRQTLRSTTYCDLLGRIVTATENRTVKKIPRLTITASGIKQLSGFEMKK